MITYKSYIESTFGEGLFNLNIDGISPVVSNSTSPIRDCSILFLPLLSIWTHHVKYLSESDPDLDLHRVRGVVDGSDLPVVVLHEVGQKTRLLLGLSLPSSVGIIAGVCKENLMKPDPGYPVYRTQRTLRIWSWSLRAGVRLRWEQTVWRVFEKTTTILRHRWNCSWHLYLTSASGSEISLWASCVVKLGKNIVIANIETNTPIHCIMLYFLSETLNEVIVC